MRYVSLLFILISLLTFNQRLHATVEHDIKHNKIVAHVKGMVCDFCARGLEKVFKKKKEVHEIKISLEHQTVDFILKPKQNLSDKIITKMIEDNGITVERIERVLVKK